LYKNSQNFEFKEEFAFYSTIVSSFKNMDRKAENLILHEHCFKDKAPL